MILCLHYFQIKSVIIVVDQMDDEFVKYSEERFNEIKNEMTSIFIQNGFDSKQFQFVLISENKNENITDDKSSNFSWWNGLTLNEIIRLLKPPKRQYFESIRVAVKAFHEIYFDDEELYQNIDPEKSLIDGVVVSGVVAPEVISEDSKIDEKSDVYSFGVTLFYLLNEGNLPHFSVQDFMSGRKAKIPDNFTNLSREIIDLCWNHNPEDRPSFKDICQKIEKAHFGLFDLNNSEQAQISEMINSYKQKFF